VNVSVPVTVPFAVGENVTATVQLAPAAMLVPQVLLAIAKPALVTMLEKLRDTLWRFVSVTLLAPLVLPTATVPKFKELEERVTGALPVPVRLTVCGLFRALSVNVSVPVTAPIAVGEKVTPTTQLAPAAILVPQVLLATAKPALVTMLEKLRATFTRLVSVTVLTALVPPTATVPKFKLLEERVTGALPVPVRVTICVPALPAIVRLPEAAPTAMGEKVTETVQEDPGAMLPLQVLV
jgi:hypothetical protein